MRSSLLIALAGAQCLGIGCGDSGEAIAPSPDGGVSGEDGGLDQVDLGPAPGWPASVSVRSIAQPFRTDIMQIETDGDRRVWLLRDEFAAAGPLDAAPVLERYDLGGHLERHITFPADSLVSSFAVHESGELSVFVLLAEQADVRYRLSILRLSADGDTLSETDFEDTPGARENLYYDDTGVHELPQGMPFRLGRGSHVSALADGDGLYLLAEWTYSTTLYRLDSAGTVVWKTQVMPANIGMVFNFTSDLMTRDEDGRIHVGYQMFEADVHIWADHFNRPALVSHGTYDELIMRFGTDGSYQAARLVGGPAVDHASALSVEGGQVLITGAARVTKLDMPNRTMEWDLMLARGSLDDDAPFDYQTLDLSRDDFAWAMARTADGTLYLGGRTDYVQVDTNSEVENGKGLFLRIGPDGETRSSLLLPGPRDVQVRAMRLLPDGRLLFAGTRDGPLTHTDPAMTFNDGVWGVARFDP